MERVDQWEEQAIEQVRQAAEATRHQLNEAIVRYTTAARTNLDRVTQELTTFHQTGSCVEADFLLWIGNLQRLKDELHTPPTISTRMDYENSSCISKLLVIEPSNDIFGESIGNVTIGSHGQQITHGWFSSFGAVRGRTEYLSGCHLVNFKVEQLCVGKENFFGIMSASSAIHSNPSFASSSVYGWTAGNSVFLNGTKDERYRNYQSDMKKDDTIELIISCDGSKIRQTNKRTENSHELDVDLAKCPLPWQLYFSLGYWGNQIRLLVADD